MDILFLLFLRIWGLVFVICFISGIFVTFHRYKFFKANQPEGLDGFGTWLWMPEDVKKAVYHGYRHGAYYDPRSGKIVRRKNGNRSIKDPDITARRQSKFKKITSDEDKGAIRLRRQDHSARL